MYLISDANYNKLVKNTISQIRQIVDLILITMINIVEFMHHKIKNVVLFKNT